MSPSRPTSLASITVPQGFVAAGGCCGIKESGRPDLCLNAAQQPCSAAAVFTTNQFKGAPVLVGMKHLNDQGHGTAQAIICNSGNSNVATLAAGGYEHAVDMCKAAAQLVGCDPHDVLPFQP